MRKDSPSYLLQLLPNHDAICKWGPKVLMQEYYPQLIFLTTNYLKGLSCFRFWLKYYYSSSGFTEYMLSILGLKELDSISPLLLVIITSLCLVGHKITNRT